MLERLGRIFPVVNELAERGSAQQVRDDLQAGLTIAILAVPQCMAYAMIAGLHPVYGLYAAIITAIVGGLLITSRHVVIGPTAKISLVVGGILYGVTGMEPTVAVVLLGLMVGFVQVGFFVLGLGNLARFVSESVISGFIIGGAIVIVGDQILKLLGPEKVKSPYFAVRVYESISELFLNPTLFHLPTFIIGAATVVVLIGLRLWNDNIPGSLIVLIIAGTFSWSVGLERFNVELIGSIPALTPTLSLPPLNSFQEISQLISGAIALALLCSVQGVSIARSIASTTLQPVNENQELLGQGMANIGAALFTGFPISASFSRSFLNFKLGARTQLSSILSGFFVAVLTAAGAGFLFYVPIPVLTGLVIVVVGEVIEVDEPLSILSSTVPDRLAFLATALGVLFLTLDMAIYLGVAVSLIFHLRKSTNLDLKEYIVTEDDRLKQIDDPNQRLYDDIALIDVNGEAFFGAATQLKDRVQTLCAHSEDLRVIILRMKNATNVDITAVAILRELALELKGQDRTLMLCGATPAIRDVLDEAGVTEIIGEDKILVAQKTLLESTRSAIERARSHIDDVLEGSDERTDEEPPLDHTMEDLDDQVDKEQDPIEDEKHGPDEPNYSS